MAQDQRQRALSDSAESDNQKSSGEPNIFLVCVQFRPDPMKDTTLCLYSKVAQTAIILDVAGRINLIERLQIEDVRSHKSAAASPARLR